MSSAEQPSRRGDGGFTLIELIVALVISGLLATVIFQLVVGQGRFTAIQGARAEVQQNSRGALELITSELRSLPSGSIDSASASSVSFRLPRAWGLLCNTLPAGGGTVGVVFPPGTFPGEFPTSFAQPTGWGLAIPDTAAGTVAVVSLTSTTAGSGTCPAVLGVPAGSNVVMRQFTFTALPAGVAAVPGDPVYVFQRVRYDVALSSSGGPAGYWIRRRAGVGNPEPLAGPLLALDQSTQGLHFTYMCDDRTLTQAQYEDPASLPSIDRVRVRVAMQSRSLTRNTFDADSDQQQQTDSMTVSLRNSRGVAPCP